LGDALHILVDRCLAGDEAAAVRFVERYQAPVFALCWRMLSHRQDAEDAAQETFVRALRSLNRWDRKRPLEPWLMAIAANRCRSTMARRARRQEIQTLPPDAIAQRADPCYAGWQLAEEVERILADMPSQHVLVFRLFHEQQLSYAEIAAACERPLGTIKTWVHRARREIAEQLAAREVFYERDQKLLQNRTTAERIAG
jgi:RNA polymerase sigma-70 factor (ECF subfamily)